MRSSGFAREAVLVAVLLCAWQASIFFMASGRALGLFAVAEPVATLETLSSDPVRAEDGILFLGPGREEPSIARLTGLEIEPGADYVVVVRAAAGLRFGLQLVDLESRKSPVKLRVPSRAENEEFAFALAAEDLARSSRVEIWNATPADLLVEELRIHELRRAYGRTWTVVRSLGLVLLFLFAVRHRRRLGGFLGLRRDQRDSARADRLAEGLVAFLLFLGCFHVFHSARVQQLIDAKFSTAVSHRLLVAGSLALPPEFSRSWSEAPPYQLAPINGKMFHLYPNAVAVLNVPFVALFSAFDLAPVGRNGLFLRHREERILVFAAAFQAAALCVFLFLLARIFLRPVYSLALTAVFAFGTQVFSTLSRSYWSHSWAVLLMAAGLYFLLAPRWRDKTSAYVLSASFVSWSFFCRPPMSLSVVGLTVLVALSRRKYLVPFIASGSAWAALFVAHSWWTLDLLLPPYFLTGYVQSGTLGPETLRVNYPRALLASLFSPGRGLFIYLPFLALVLLVVARFWRRLPRRELVITALAVSFAHWQLISTNKGWSGGGFGPRLFSDIVVWLFLLAVLALAAWVENPSPSRVWRASVRAAAVLLVAASVFIHTRGATARATITWRGFSYWDWRHPQFLAGLERRPRPLAERVASFALEPRPETRDALVEEIVRSESLAKRLIDGERMFATAVTWDHWTYGSSPGVLVVTNPEPRVYSPRLGLATWATADVYPITVSIEDGEAIRRHVLPAPGVHEIQLASVAANSTRLYLVQSDKAWSPGGRDPRELGVQLRAAKKRGENSGS